MNFLEQVQSLDEGTKTKILIVATALVMVVVVIVWFAYFNAIVVGGANQPAAAETVAAATPQNIAISPTAPAAPSESLWARMGDGLASLYSAFHSPRQYNITPQ